MLLLLRCITYMKLNECIVSPLKEPTGVALHPVIPALWLPLLSTPPFLSVVPLSSSSSLQRCQRKNSHSVTLSLSVSLSLPQPHSVGYVKAVTLLLAGPLAGYKSCEPCQSGEGSHCGECVCVCVCAIRCSVCLCAWGWLCHTWAPPLAACCLNSDTNQQTPSSWKGGEGFLWNIPLSPQRSDQRFLFSLPCPSLLPLACLPVRLSHLHFASTPVLSSSISPPPHLPLLHTPWAGPMGPAPPTPQTGGLPDSLWVSWRTTFYYQSDRPSPETPLLISPGHCGPERDLHLWGYTSLFRNVLKQNYNNFMFVNPSRVWNNPIRLILIFQ